MRLAEHLGKSVGEILSTMDSRELTEWLVWERIHGPLGAERFDYLAASISATVAEIHRNRQKRLRPFQISEFLPFDIPGAARRRGQRIVSKEALIEWARAMAARQEAIRAKG